MGGYSGAWWVLYVEWLSELCQLQRDFLVEGEYWEWPWRGASSCAFYQAEGVGEWIAKT